MHTLFSESKVRDQLGVLDEDGGTCAACDRPSCVCRRLKTTDGENSDQYFHRHHRYHKTFTRHHPREVSGSSVLSFGRASVPVLRVFLRHPLARSSADPKDSTHFPCFSKNHPIATSVSVASFASYASVASVIAWSSRRSH